MKKVDAPDDITPEGTNVISIIATLTRVMLDVKTKDGRFFDPLDIGVVKTPKGPAVPGAREPGSGQRDARPSAPEIRKAPGQSQVEPPRGEIFGQVRSAARQAQPQKSEPEQTTLVVTYDGTTDRWLKILNFTFDTALHNIVNIFADPREKGFERSKEKAADVMNFLRQRSVKMSGFLPTAYDVRYGNMREYKNPGGPSAWIAIQFADYI